MKIEINSWVNRDRIIVKIITEGLYIFEYDEDFTQYLQDHSSTRKGRSNTADRGIEVCRSLQQAWEFINLVVKRVRYEVDLTKKLEEDIKRLPTEINID